MEAETIMQIRNAFKELRGRIEKLEAQVASQRTLLVDLRGEPAVELHESMNPEEK